MTNPLAVARNLTAKAWRRGAAAPKRLVRVARRVRFREQLDLLQTEWGIERELASLARSKQPIVAGPWLSEVGFEVLYWIPFLRWLEDRYRIDRERVIAVSRGGVSSWYEDVASTYVEIFDQMDPVTFSRRNAERRDSGESGGQKHKRLSALDDDLFRSVKRQVGADDALLCHPRLMYVLFDQFWSGNRPLDLVMSRTRHRPLRVPAPADLRLPDHYVAAKFYTGTALPNTADHRRQLRELVYRISQRTPVVLLDTGLKTDEHEDYLFQDLPNVHSLRRHLAPRTNLGIQTAVLGGAQGFIGTCGSLAWFGPMLGVDTVAVYADTRFLVSHLFFATHVYRRMGAARFDTLDLGAAMEFSLAASADTVAACESTGST